MKLVHLIMKRPEDDVSLSDGELFMVKHPPYAEHLAHTPQKQPVSSHKSIVHLSSDNLTNVKKSRCSNHRAQNNGNLHRKHLDSTGKGACACARHGAFVPHCVVDFQKGEWWVYPTP